jgi:hypothetical protein
VDPSRRQRRHRGVVGGPLAEERVAGSYDHETAEHDLDRMFDQAMVVTLGFAQEALAYVEWLRWRTVRFLHEPGRWSQVEAVAAALLERRSLAAPDVGRAMSAAGRPPAGRRRGRTRR